jgi:hypothetical protein
MPSRTRAIFKWVVLPLMLEFVACGGTWVDDSGNFKRIFGLAKPDDVQVIHSYYWKSAHWTTEYRYYIELKASSEFIAGITSTSLMRRADPRFDNKPEECSVDKPLWFLPKPLTNYEAWLPSGGKGYRVFRDRTSNELFVCDELL